MRHTAAARAAHDLGLAAWFGSELLGAIALNGASMEVDDPTQRARVANAGWMRISPLVGLAFASHSAGTVALIRAGELPSPLTPGTLARVRTVTTVAAVAATAWSGLLGRRVVSAGDVPTASSVQPIAETPDDVARAMRRLAVVQWVLPALTGLLWVVNAAQLEYRLGRRRRPWR